MNNFQWIFFNFLYFSKISSFLEIVCYSTFLLIPSKWIFNFHNFCTQFTDSNECGSATHNCHGNATCNNTDGSFTCACDIGYNGNGVTCTGTQTCNFIYIYNWYWFKAFTLRFLHLLALLHYFLNFLGICSYLRASSWLLLILYMTALSSGVATSVRLLLTNAMAMRLEPLPIDHIFAQVMPDTM